MLSDLRTSQVPSASSTSTTSKSPRRSKVTPDKRSMMSCSVISSRRLSNAMILASNSGWLRRPCRRLPSTSTCGSRAHGNRQIARRSRASRATSTASPHPPRANKRPRRTGNFVQISISASLYGRRSSGTMKSACGSARIGATLSSMSIKRRSPRRRKGIDGDSSISCRGSSMSASSNFLVPSAASPPRPSISVCCSSSAPALNIRSVMRLSRASMVLPYYPKLQVTTALTQQPFQTK